MSQKTLAAQIEVLRRMSLAELRDRYQALFGHECRLSNKTWLLRRCAWRIQEIELGGLSGEARDRLEALMAEIKLPIGSGRTVRGRLAKPDPGILQPGTTLVRDYKGQPIRVTVRETGFEWGGEVYASLSAVARAVTGSKWNGKLFFGLSQRTTRAT